MDYNLNGLDITVEYNGFWSRDRFNVIEFWITHVGNKKCKKTVDIWLQKRMNDFQIEDLQNAISAWEN